MNYLYQIEKLDCANCASKVEAAVLKVEGVKACSVNFFAQKLKLETELPMTDSVYNAVLKAVKKAEPGVKLVALSR